jgi:hypothetical protein
VDLAGEPASIHRLVRHRRPNPLKAAYARNCLLARRLLERGVRYVNLYCASRASGVDGLLNWDAHKTLKSDYERHCPIFDQPTAALLTDLKQRGLLADTLVLWTTEFGRMPTHQAGTTGRDHNPDGFTCWLMGAGRQRRHQLRSDGRVRSAGRGGCDDGLGLLRHGAAPAGLRPPPPDLVLQWPGPPLDRRPRPADRRTIPLSYRRGR